MLDQNYKFQYSNCHTKNINTLAANTRRHKPKIVEAPKTPCDAAGVLLVVLGAFVVPIVIATAARFMSAMATVSAVAVERCKGSVELFKPEGLHEDTSQQD